MKSGKTMSVTAVLIILFIFISWGKIFGTGATPAIESGEGVSSIATLEKINIGGMEQWVLIRGNNTSNPLLLWLHGGPGASQMPVAHHFHRALEKEFVVVQWDQRGAGKSNPGDFAESTMTFERFVEDAHELTAYLKKRFNKNKIYLLGHSWGTHMGIVLARNYPEDYYAYVGVSQVIDYTSSHKIAYEWLSAEIKEKGDSKDLKKLQDLGLPPYTDHNKFVKFISLVDSYGGGFDIDMLKLVWIALQAPEYTLGDYLAWIKGSSRGSGPMWETESYRSFNAVKDVPVLDLPVYFMNGINDYNTPLELVEEYFNHLLAPKGKRIIRFNQSAHTPFFNETEKFDNELKRIKDETYM